MSKKKINNTDLSPLQEEIMKDLGDAKALSALASSEGGKLIIKALKSEITSSIDSLTTSFKTATAQELVASLALLKARIDMLRVFVRADSARKTLEDVWIESLAE